MSMSVSIITAHYRTVPLLLLSAPNTAETDTSSAQHRTYSKEFF